MMRRRAVFALLAIGVYAASMLFAFGATGALTQHVSSIASDLVPTTSSHPYPYGPYGSHEKTTLCHNGVTITVDDAAVPAHLAQGDTLGPCGGPSRKTTMCHNGTTITVSNNSVDEHLKQGDTLGPCPPGTRPPAP